MLNSISPISQNKVAFKGDTLDKTKTENQEVAQNKNKSWMLWTGLAALGAVGIYIATKGKGASEATEKASEAGQDIATKATDSVKEEAKKVLEKLPSRKEVLESLGIKLNDEKFLTVMKKGPDGKEVEELYNGTYSYTARNGVNIKETIESGVVSRREMFTQKTIDNPVIKDYEYYGRGQNLRGIETIHRNDNRRFFVLKDQKSLQNLRASLNYVPKTDDEIKALNAQGIKYELAEEITNIGQSGARKNLKEIYTYPDGYPIKSKEVYYGNRNCTSNDGKEITLTFREPQQTSNPYYKADGFKLNIRNNGFNSDLLGGYNLERFEKLYDTSAIPFNYKTKAYKEIMEVLNQEYSVDSLKKIRYGHS